MPEDTEWLKSSFCADGQCVEVRKQGDVVLVRDGKNPFQPHFEFTSDDWLAFLDHMTVNSCNVPVGRSIYTPLLTADGGGFRPRDALTRLELAHALSVFATNS